MLKTNTSRKKLREFWNVTYAIYFLYIYIYIYIYIRYRIIDETGWEAGFGSGIDFLLD